MPNSPPFMHFQVHISILNSLMNSIFLQHKYIHSLKCLLSLSKMICLVFVPICYAKRTWLYIQSRRSLVPLQYIRDISQCENTPKHATVKEWSLTATTEGSVSPFGPALFDPVSHLLWCYSHAHHVCYVALWSVVPSVVWSPVTAHLIDSGM